MTSISPSHVTRADRGPSRRFACLGAFALAITAASFPALAEPKISPELAQRLTPAQLAAYRAYLSARGTFDKQLEMYWALIEERRDHRRRKRSTGQPFVAADFIAEQPPKYQGPAMPPDVAQIIASLEPPSDPKEVKELPTVRDFLNAARHYYGFVPAPIAEREFKRRYAIEALAAGLSKTQVVRVYALETGGQGTVDMQAGIDPITKTGKPISSALGYAQLLHANSISELVKYGEQFIQRLSALAADPSVPPAHAQTLPAKIAAVQKMLTVARSVPNEWSQHQKIAQTPQGYGIHALNLDADIGPWLQVVKLKGLLTMAAENGRANLTGAELELMNLAGPRTGLDMMDPVGRGVPTANFFSQGGYYRNTIVREKTAAQLLTALDERMNVNALKPGAIEFAAVFDEVLAGLPPRPGPSRAEKPEKTKDVFASDR